MNKSNILFSRGFLMGHYLSALRFVLVAVVTMTMLAPPVFCQDQAGADRPKVGLALGGGGARGAAHVSVLKVLEEEGIPIDYISGTSIGSVVGGLYAAGVPLKQIEREFHTASIMRSFMTVPLWVRLVAAPVMVLPRLVGFHPYDGLYFGNKFRNFLTRNVPGYREDNGKNIEDLNIPYCAVVTSLIDGKAHSLKKGDIGYAMQASCAVPGLRKPVEIDGDLYVDGGILVNVPVPQVREMGADIVIAVNIDEPFDRVPLDTFRAMGSVSKRVIKLELANVDAPLCAQADYVIHPNTEGIGLTSRSKKDAIKGLKAGEEAARAAIPEIKKLLSEAGVKLNASAKAGEGQAL